MQKKKIEKNENLLMVNNKIEIRVKVDINGMKEKKWDRESSMLLKKLDLFENEKHAWTNSE